ncbi:MAG: rhodanese-related sulfurtransferase [Chlamydiota bacterium]|nr:rhodanese-related sulfurtransferase [Chlamydiota bacterium]
MDYSVVAFYHFFLIENPQQEVEIWKEGLRKRGAKGRIYINTQGINAQFSISNGAKEEAIEWIHARPHLQEAFIKIHPHHEHPFPKLTIKVREQLVAIDRHVDLTDRGTPLSPKEWKERLENRDPQTLLLDVRNDYEWEVGHFQGSLPSGCQTFRDFPERIQALKEKYPPSETPIMMYCTGGIRCEIYSSLMKEEGFKEVYQLEGGIIQYGEEEGKNHWEGGLFVFDDRLVVSIDGKPGGKEVISHCIHCQEPSDRYYNCANMSCNALFLSCPTCAESLRGCCSSECQGSSHCRPFIPQDRPKPFRKLSRTS